MDADRGSAPARAAIAGNPSDGYGGAVLAVTIETFVAEVEISGADGPQATAPADTVLIDATRRRFEREFGAAAPVAWRTSVPRSVGLGGSSAIVIATLRALSARHGVVLAPDAMAELALSIEVDDLGIVAGLQDRIAQCFGGLVFMEFGEPAQYERLERELLPPLLIAWRERTAAPSDVVHRDLRARFEAGDPVVRDAMSALATLARRARDAVLAGDVAELSACADGSFDARARMLELDTGHVEMIEIARSLGAGANYTGSGGAVVCVCKELRHREAVAHALRAAGCETAEI